MRYHSGVRHIAAFFLAAALLSFALIGHGQDALQAIALRSEAAAAGTQEQTGGMKEGAETQPAAAHTEAPLIYAHVGGVTLEILLAPNSSAEAFSELLAKGDILVEMLDYGNFEKVGDIGTTLPANNERITTEPGDVILWMGNSISIYYDVNTWDLTRLGKVQRVSQEELKAVLGKGDVTVIFSLSKSVE